MHKKKTSKLAASIDSEFARIRPPNSSPKKSHSCMRSLVNYCLYRIKGAKDVDNSIRLKRSVQTDTKVVRQASRRTTTSAATVVLTIPGGCADTVTPLRTSN